jgi:hypothetical protein
VIRSVVAFLAAASTSLCVIFLPLALGYALIRKTRAAWIVATAFYAGLALQLAVVLHTHNEVLGGVPHQSVFTLVKTTVVRVFAMFLIGPNGIAAFAGHEILLILGSTFCVGIILGVLLPGTSLKSQMVAIVLIAYSVVSFAAPVWYRSNFAFFGQYLAPSRYSVIPVLLLASGVAVLVTATGSGRAQVGSALFVTSMLVLIFIGFSVTNLRSPGPNWSSSASRTYLSGCLGKAPNKIVEVQTENEGAAMRLVVSHWDWRQHFPVIVQCRDLGPSRVSSS